MNPLQSKHSISISAASVIRDGKQLFDLSAVSPSDIPVHLYRSLGISYPKFFKMDRIAKLGFIATELLIQVVDSDYDKEKVALLLTTADGCRDVDEKFESSRTEIPSPALFVYTLPNIVAGEICIRNGFKGGANGLDCPKGRPLKMRDAYLYCLFAKGNTNACLTGYLNAYQDDISCELSWIENYTF